MYIQKYRWVLPFLASLLVVMACGQLAVEVMTPTPAALLDEAESAATETQSSMDFPDGIEQTTIPTPVESPTPAPSPTSEWSQYWVEVQDPYHDLRFAMPCFWLSQFPPEDYRGDGAFSYPVKNYPEDYVFNFPRSVIPPEAGAIKIDMNFMSVTMSNLPPGTSQIDFVNALFSFDSETRLVSTQEAEINGQQALFVTTESIFGQGNFYLLTATDELFLAFGTASELMDHPDVQGILNSIALSSHVPVRIPEHKPAPPPTGLAAPCIPGYEQAIVPTIEIPIGNTACGLSSFVDLDLLVETVQQKLIERNYGSLHYDGYTNDPFTIGYWGSEGTTLNPMETQTQLANNLLPPNEVVLTFTTNRAEFPPLAGMPPENMFGPNLKVAQVVYSEGWGADGQASALLYFAQDQCGGYYWHGLVYDHGQFDQ
jgi:hypothetical protein